jgi:hypothetical protein
MQSMIKSPLSNNGPCMPLLAIKTNKGYSGQVESVGVTSQVRLPLILSITIQSKPRNGTRILVELPVVEHEAER